MGALAWMLTWTLSGLSSVLPAMAALPPPVNVTLTSDHFVHVLTWQRGPGTPPGVTYRVSVIPDTGKSWRAVPSCQAVQDPLVCNLTQELSDPLQQYFASVRAELQTQTSPTASPAGFKPIRDAVLGPPVPSVALCGRSLCVRLQPPLQHLQHVYDRLKFRVNVSRDGAMQLSQDGLNLSGLVVDDVTPGRRYCVWVSVSDPDEGQQSEYSQPECLTTSNTFDADLLVSVLLCLLLLAAAATVALMFFAGFFCLRRRMLPSVLTSLRHIKELPVLTVPFASSFASLHVVDVVAPPAGQTRSLMSSSSEHSEDESDGESVAGGGAYLIKGGPICSSSSASSSSVSPPSRTSPGALGSVETAPPAGDALSAETAPPAGDAQSAETAPPAGDAQSAEKAPPAEDALSAETAPPAGDAQSAEKAPPAGDAQSAETAPPAGDAQSAETAPPAGDAQSAEKAPPAGDAQSAETAPPAGDAQSAEKAPPAGDALSAETAPPAGDAQSAETAPPAGDALSAETAPPAGDALSLCQAAGGGGGAEGPDVDLLTLTFGRQQGEREGEREDQNAISPSSWRVGVEGHHDEYEDDDDDDDGDEDDDDGDEDDDDDDDGDEDDDDDGDGDEDDDDDGDEDDEDDEDDGEPSGYLRH